MDYEAIVEKNMWMPDTSVAKYVKKIFTGFWSGQEEVSSFVQSDVSGDEDKHIRMSVEEVLSDEVCVQLLVQYTAKDEEGQKWLKKYGPAQRIKKDDGKQFCVRLGGKNGGIGGAFYAAELVEYRSEKEQYFTFMAPDGNPIEITGGYTEK